jgi:L-2,4-diaminobutyric acid acetyltransferase
MRPSTHPFVATHGQIILTIVEDFSAATQVASDDRNQFSGHTPRRLLLRQPVPEDGPAITRLIAASPPLDRNSAYCNLLQCTDFADTCVVAELGSKVVGWISAYQPPSAPDRLFVWQVAVAQQARGTGLAGTMLDSLIERPAASGAAMLVTTITSDNAPSWALFEAFARRHHALIERVPRFEREAHFGGAHDTEWEARIAPLPQPSK